MLIKRAVSVAKGSAEPHKTKVGKITLKQVEEIARIQDAISTASMSKPPCAQSRHRPLHGHRRSLSAAFETKLKGAEEQSSAPFSIPSG